MNEVTRLTRRQFVKRTAAAGAGVALLSKFAVPSARAINNTSGLQKWIQPLRGLNYPAGHLLESLGYPNDSNGLSVLGGTADLVFPGTTFYRVSIQEFTDQLHPALGPTKLWGYVDQNRPLPRHFGGLVVTVRNQAARMRFTNNLPDRHLLPVDTTVAGGNQGQNRVAVHLHGGLVPWLSDGGPFEWFSPGCPDFTSGLSFLNGPGGIFDNITAMPMQPGQADYYYPNNQSTRLMWYHDHAYGLTRLNAMAGLATGYLCVDPADDAARLTASAPAYADLIPVIWNDMKFVDPKTTPLTDPTWANVTRPDVQTLGSVWYEHTYNPKIWTLKAGLPIPDPSVIAEFFGDTAMANGQAFPVVNVQPKAYRLMLLNACSARFLNVNTFVADKSTDGITLSKFTQFPTNPAGPAMHQIGNEGGYLMKEVVWTTSAATALNPATLKGNLILGPAERADVVIDFAPFAGQDIIIYNDAPAPFPGGAAINDYYPGNAANPIVTAPGFGPDTRQLLRIHVAAGAATPNPGPFLTDMGQLDPAPLATLNPVPPAGPITQATPIGVLTPPPGTPVRPLTLNETFDKYGRLIQLLGTTVPQVGGGFGQPIFNAPTEVVSAGAMEVWQIYNTTADTHPMHFHLVNAQVLSRQPFKMNGTAFLPSGVARGPDVNELGWKETIKMHPGEVTSILMKFDLPQTLPGDTPLPFTVPSSPRVASSLALLSGKTTAHEYVWHCHILEHEEHDMMRPIVVGS